MRLPLRTPGLRLPRPDLPTVALAAVAAALRLPLVVAALPGFSNSDEPVNLLTGFRMADAGTVDPGTYRYPSLLYDVIATTTRLFRLAGLPAPAHGALRIQNLGVAHTEARALVVAIRLTGVAVSVATCLVVGRTVRAAGGSRWAGVLGAGIVAVSPLMAADSAYATPDTYAGLAVALTVYGAVAVLQGAPRAGLWSGLGIGLALGSKYLAAAALPVLAALVIRGRPAFVRDLMTTTSTALAVFLLTTPVALWKPGAVFAGFTAEVHHYSTAHPGAEGGAAGYYLSALIADQPITLVGLLGAGFALRRLHGLRRSALVVTLAYIVPQLVLLAALPVRFDRNLVAVTPALAVAAGLTAAAFAAAPHRRVLAAAIAAVAVLPAVSAARLYPRLDERSRTEAAAWITAHVAPGTPIAVEGYGPWLDPHRYRLTTPEFAATAAGGSDSQVLVLTQHAAGRFLDDPARYPAEAGAYRTLLTRYTPAASFADGSWITVYIRR